MLGGGCKHGKAQIYIKKRNKNWKHYTELGGGRVKIFSTVFFNQLRGGACKNIRGPLTTQ